VKEGERGRGREAGGERKRKIEIERLNRLVFPRRPQLHI